MNQTDRRSLPFANNVVLPDRVFTRSGTSIDPKLDVWEWFDGPFWRRINFEGFSGGFETLVPYAKQALIPYVKGHSAAYVATLFYTYSNFADVVQTCPESCITEKHIVLYVGAVGLAPSGQLGVLYRFLSSWVKLGLPGVDVACIDLLQRTHKSTYAKGRAVRTRDPVSGPFSEGEYKALYSAVNVGYERGEYPLWALILTRLLLACGGRISQYASLKICDFDSSRKLIRLPTAKTGLGHTRCHFIDFEVSSQTRDLLYRYVELLLGDGYLRDSPLFPEARVMPRGSRNGCKRNSNDVYFDHCEPKSLSRAYLSATEWFSPPSSRLDYAPIPLSPRRFRYTFGTRLAEEGASKVVIANRLGHVDLQNVDCYVSASPRVVENLDRSLGPLLAPLSRAFQGQLVEDESASTQKGGRASRIIDFRVSSRPVGSCAQSAASCALIKPVGCYTCFRFEPWLDAPHEEIKVKLMQERAKYLGDERMAAINDEAIRAVQEVMSLCSQVKAQREAKGTP